MASDPFPPPPEEPINPYAAPLTDLGPEGHLPELVAARPEMGDIISRSWELFKQQLWPCVGAGLIFLVLLFAFQFLLTIFQSAVQSGGFRPGVGPQPSPALFLSVVLVSMIAQFLFQSWLTAGLALFMLDVGRGRVASFGQLFAGTPYLLRAFLANILLFLCIFGIYILTAVPTGVAFTVLGRDSSAWLIVLVVMVVVAVVAAIFLSIRLYQFLYILVDRDTGALESLRQSLAITRGNVLTILVIYLLAFAINAAGLLACLVGVLFTAPFTMVMSAVLYLALTGQSAAGKGGVLPELEPI